MTPDERNLLNDLATRFSQTPAAPRDPEAEDLIRTKIGNRPDALYLMTQTVLIQNMALQRAQQQLQDLQSRAPQGQVSGIGSSWLGQSAPASSGSYSQAPQPQYAPAQAPPQYAAPAPSFGGGSSFLRGAAQTAAGVAAGSLAAEAIGSMFSHGGGMFGGGNALAGGGGMAPTEEVVNNYYDSPSGGGQDYRDAGGESNFDDSAIQNDQTDDGSQLDDSSSQFDDASLDDGGGFDSGSDDSFS